MVPIGESIELGLLRDGRPLTAKAQIAKPLEVPSISEETVPQLAGASVANIKPGSPLYGKVEGVLVTKVEANSPAWQHGIRPGDIIIGINRRKVRSVQEFLAALKTGENVIMLSLLRGDFRLTIVIR